MVRQMSFVLTGIRRFCMAWSFTSDALCTALQAKSSGARVLVLVLLVAQCASRSLAAAASSKASSGSSVDLVVAKAVAIR
jgi:hypothetical protein